MLLRQPAPWLAALIAAGCATGITLTSNGARVQNVPQTEIPPGCNLLGDVPIGIPPDAARPRTEEQLVILMRNKAAEMGGNRVYVETSRQNGSGTEAYWSGRGVAYMCSDEDLEAPPAPREEEEPTAEEAPSEEEEAPPEE